MNVSTHLTIEELAESISIVVNEIERYYKYYFPKDFKDFNPSISEDNFKIL